MELKRIVKVEVNANMSASMDSEDVAIPGIVVARIFWGCFVALKQEQGWSDGLFRELNGEQRAQKYAGFAVMLLQCEIGRNNSLMELEEEDIIFMSEEVWTDIERREDGMLTYEGLMNLLHTASSYVESGLENFPYSRASEWPAERRIY